MSIANPASSITAGEFALDNPTALDPFRRSTCRFCAAELSAPFLDLGAMPLANSFTRGAVAAGRELTCPLSITYCRQCHLVQLTHVIPAQLIFSHYLYVSSTSKSFQRHFTEYAQAVSSWFPQNTIGLAVDIGSNDGALVSSFIQRGISAVGVDPARNLSEEANRRGIPTINRYFDQECVDTIIAQYGLAGVVTANNVFAHVDDVPAFCRNVHRLLRQDGLLVIEFPYLPIMCDKMLFDMIYHEHLSYLSISAVQYILSTHQFEIIAINQVPSHGGSLRVVAQKADARKRSDDRWQEYLVNEKRQGYQDVARYEEFAAKVHRVKARLQAFIGAERAAGRMIVGYGAPAKANTLINFCQWSQNDFAYIVDDSPLKQGLNAPGSGIPVLAPQQLIENPPDAVMVFAWNFAEEIITKMRPLLPPGVQWIIPLPEPVYL